MSFGGTSTIRSAWLIGTDYPTHYGILRGKGDCPPELRETTSRCGGSAPSRIAGSTSRTRSALYDHFIHRNQPFNISWPGVLNNLTWEGELELQPSKAVPCAATNRATRLQPTSRALLFAVISRAATFGYCAAPTNTPSHLPCDWKPVGSPQPEAGDLGHQPSVASSRRPCCPGSPSRRPTSTSSQERDRAASSPFWKTAALRRCGVLCQMSFLYPGYDDAGRRARPRSPYAHHFYPNC